MPLKTEPLEEPSLNLASMLDIVMLLLMFFVLGTQFKEDEKEYAVQLPLVSDAKAISGQPDEIVVNVSQNGAITINGQAYSANELEQYLLSARQRFPGQGVVIRGDSQVPYQYVMDALAAARRAGIRNLSLAHKPAAP